MSTLTATLWPLSRRQTAGLLTAILALAWLSCHASERVEWRDKMQSIIPKGYLCQYASNAITVDGSLDDPAWALVPWTSDFADISGAGQAAPRFRTRAKMLWDDHYLYICAELEEP